MSQPETKRHALSHPRSHPRLGINCDRGCTDCPVLLLFLIVWCGAVFVADLGFKNGKPANLIRGIDFQANTCGLGDFADRPLLWYPISFNMKTGDLEMKSALKMGVCVAACPKVGDRVYLVPKYNISGTYMPDYWFSLFNSKPKLNRCFPDFGSFDCVSSVGNASACFKSLARANSSWSSLSQFGDVFEDGFNTVMQKWWIIPVGIVIVIVLSFFWLFLLRFIVKPIVVITCLLVLLALGGLGYALWYIKGLKENLDPPQTEEANYYMYGAIAAWIVTFVYLCVLIFIREDLMTACDIIEEATHVPRDIPTMMLVPPISFVACLPFIVFFLIVAVFIQSSGDVVSFYLPLNATLDSAASSLNITSLNGTHAILAREYTFSNWRVYAHFYNLFVMLWSVGLVGAISFMILAMCGVFWYWSIPGDNKEPPLGSVCIATKLVLRYHLGTVALGSLLVALIQLMRVILAFMENHLQQVKERTDAAKFIFACLECYLAYLERVVKFINKNGYIMCAMQGSSFVSSARDALSLLAENALSVGALTIISEYVIIFGKIVVTIAGVLVTWQILQVVDDGGLSGGWVILLTVLVLGYIISCLFANVFSVCIDTVLLCYCYDKREAGDDYFPSDLAAHVSKTVLEKGKKLDAMNKKDTNVELATKLAPGKPTNPKGDPLDCL